MSINEAEGAPRASGQTIRRVSLRNLQVSDAALEQALDRVVKESARPLATACAFSSSI